MRRIRVVHMVEALGLGGLERTVALLARGASPRFAVEVITLAGGGPVADEMEVEGTRVRRLRLLKTTANGTARGPASSECPRSKPD